MDTIPDFEEDQVGFEGVQVHKSLPDIPTENRRNE